MATTINTILLARRGTASQWASSTYKLEVGEFGFDTTNNILKMGNGTDLFKDLPYANQAEIAKAIKVVDDKFANYTTTAGMNTILNGYVTESELSTALANHTPNAHKHAMGDINGLDDALGDKVDKVTGKSLVSDTEITKLAGVSTGANKVEASGTNGNIKVDGTEVVVYTHPAKHAIGDVTGLQDALTTNANAATQALTDAKKYTDDLADEIESDYVKKSQATGYDDILTKTDANTTYAKKATTLAGYGITDAYTASAGATLEGKVTTNTSDISTLKQQITGLSGAVHFVGAKTTSEFGLMEANDYNVGDIVMIVSDSASGANNDLVGKEFICAGDDGTHDWVELGDTTQELQRISALETTVGSLEEEGSGLVKQVRDLEAASHTHDNKAVLDGIDASEVTSWNNTTSLVTANKNTWNKAGTAVQPEDITDVVANSHTHTNKGILDNIDEQRVNKWDDTSDYIAQNKNDLNDAITKKHSHTFTDADVLDAIDKEHTHGNKTVLDGITAAKVTAWDNSIDNVVAGTSNEDISVAVANGVATVSHKGYQSGTIAVPAETEENPHFLTSVTISNGHITTASARSLADTLAAMSFIFDGGKADGTWAQ